MAQSTSVWSKTTQTVLNVSVGVLSVAAVVGAIWALLGIVGAVVAWITTMLGGQPGMWSTESMFEVVDDPSYASVGFGFLGSVGTSLCIGAFVLAGLHGTGKAILSMVRSQGTSSITPP